MPLRLFNTLKKCEEEFVPLEPLKVRMYTCGPTVYGRPHIGNYSSFLMADLLRRWLEVSGCTVKHVKNITDVGHLAADQDDGEDKIERQARCEKESSCVKASEDKREKKEPKKAEERQERGALTAEDVLAVARKYEEQYLTDESALGLLEPFARPRATETIREMIAIIQILLVNGHAYETPDGMYFSIRSFPGYGKLSGNILDKLGKLVEGVRVTLSEAKRDPADFALWKKCVGENSRHLLRWAFPEGGRVSSSGEDPLSGFPGWHIECSAMSTKFLGQEIDIHTGGEDNIFPHHECEIAQSECAFGKPFVRYWLHKRRVNFAQEKMSKSLGNILTLPDIRERGFDPLDLRYCLLSAHYRSHTQFTWKGLDDAKKARLKVMEWMGETLRGHGTKGGKRGGGASLAVEKWQEKFAAAMDADLNTPTALGVVFDCIAWSRTHSSQLSVPDSRLLRAFMAMVEHTFGCFTSVPLTVPDQVRALIAQREEARRGGDYKRSDVLRKEILDLGFVLEDLPDGTRVIAGRRRG